MNLDIIGKVAEGKIQEAIEEGKFENLPGKGKPLVFDDDPATPAHIRMANKVLKNAGALPEWLQIRKDILEEREEIIKLKTRLIRDNQAKRQRLVTLPAYHVSVRQYAEWHARSRAEVLRHYKSVNDGILKFCLIAPSTAEPLTPFRIEQEMRAFDEVFPPLEQQEAVTLPETRPEGALKGIARARYQENERKIG
ncbi:MAG TPA: DUF1992 domain-containing protein [Chthonomonadaceae bacterium]|nr:DUF1992 domain-containing protein [Chthonomonadaceae bacterium]